MKDDGVVWCEQLVRGQRYYDPDIPIPLHQAQAWSDQPQALGTVQPHLGQDGGKHPTPTASNGQISPVPIIAMKHGRNGSGGLSRRFEANVGIDLLAWTSGSYRRAVVSQFEGYKPRQ